MFDLNRSYTFDIKWKAQLSEDIGIKVIEKIKQHKTENHKSILGTNRL